MEASEHHQFQEYRVTEVLTHGLTLVNTTTGEVHTDVIFPEMEITEAREILTEVQRKFEEIVIVGDVPRGQFHSIEAGPVRSGWTPEET